MMTGRKRIAIVNLLIVGLVLDTSGLESSGLCNVSDK